MKKILVPTDFSPNANRAVDYAVQIATRNQATLYIIHACDELFSFEGGLSAAEQKYNAGITEAAFSRLELLRNSIEETEGLLVNTQVYKGTVADTIPLAAAEHHADLVIMGTLGITGLADKIFGTNTAAAISHSPVPVLAIPLEYEWSYPSKFLLCINHFEESTGQLQPVFDLAAVFGAEVQVAVFTDEDEATASVFMANARDIQYLAQKLEREYKNVVLTGQHLSGKQFADTVTDFIREQQVDLLAMIRHRRKFPGSLFNRSLTRKMSYHSRVPLLAIPANSEI